MQSIKDGNQSIVSVPYRANIRNLSFNYILVCIVILQDQFVPITHASTKVFATQIQITITISYVIAWDPTPDRDAKYVSTI